MKNNSEKIRNIEKYRDALFAFYKMYVSAMILPILRITDYCENGFKHCYGDFSCKNDIRNHMPEEDAFYILKELKNSGYCYTVNVMGGEPSHIEKVNPGYNKRILKESLRLGLETSFETNGTWIRNKEIRVPLLQDLVHIYTKYNELFKVQMSLDSYHKKCVYDVNKVIKKFSRALPRANQKFQVSVMRFKHEPWFKKELTAVGNGGNMFIKNKAAWDLNKVGRAAINNLSHCRNTLGEFKEFCAKQNEFWELSLSVINFGMIPGVPATMLDFRNNGMVTAHKWHDPENRNQFQTPLKENGKYRPLDEIQADLASQIFKDFIDKISQNQN